LENVFLRLRWPDTDGKLVCPGCGCMICYSKDHRPELMQMIVAVVIDADGRPICSEMWPGNTALC
jgi:hypothetical protein